MKKSLISLFVLLLSATSINAQQSFSAEKSKCSSTCSKSCTKSCCSKASNSKKSCSGFAYSKTVSVKEFLNFAKQFPAEQIVDIRTADEVNASGKLEGAVNINYSNSSEFKSKMNELDKNAAVMIYCHSGNRSSKAIPLLKSWGFKKIYEMDGGYSAYQSSLKK